MVRHRAPGGVDLRKIAESGQCFRWEEEAGAWRIPAFSRCVLARDDGENLYLDCTEREYEEVWRSYFDMDRDYAAVRAEAEKADAFLREAAAAGRGIRILRQDLWETAVTFLISQNNNIPRIRKTVERLCRLEAYPGFPSPERVAALDETALREMGLGYRAPYLARCAERFAREKERQKRLDREGKEAACGYLRSFPGIGPKVAECIALFGLGYTGAFPRDTWIKRIEEAHYGGRFPDEKYPGTAGVMQQYLFFYARLRETERANAPG